MTNWYFLAGLGGIGGWIIFLVIALAPTIWMFVDGFNRSIKAFRWLIGSGAGVLVILPALVIHFSGSGSSGALADILFYLGVIGGIIPVILAVGYFISYQGLMGCENHHLYDASLAECPVCNKKQGRVEKNTVVYENSMDETELPQRPRQSKPRARAILVDLSTNDRYDLLLGETRIGRKATVNDVVITNPTVGREHVLIREQNGHFTLFDRGSSSGTYVNDQRVKGSTLLESGDEITLGEVQLRFLMA